MLGASRILPRRLGGSGKLETAEAVRSACEGHSPKQEASDPLGATVAGRAKWNNKSYYLAGKVLRGRTTWDDEVDCIRSRSGGMLLLTHSGHKVWAPEQEVSVTKTYQRPKTIKGLQAFAERVKRGEVEFEDDDD